MGLPRLCSLFVWCLAVLALQGSSALSQTASKARLDRHGDSLPPRGHRSPWDESFPSHLFRLRAQSRWQNLGNRRIGRNPAVPCSAGLKTCTSSGGPASISIPKLVAFSPNGALFWTAGPTSPFGGFHRAEALDRDGFFPAAFSPDTKSVVVSDSWGRIRLLDLTTGRPLRRLDLGSELDRAKGRAYVPHVAFRSGKAIPYSPTARVSAGEAPPVPVSMEWTSSV